MGMNITNFENKYINFQEIALSFAADFMAVKNKFYKPRHEIITNNFVSY